VAVKQEFLPGHLVATQAAGARHAICCPPPRRAVNVQIVWTLDLITLGTLTHIPIDSVSPAQCFGILALLVHYLASSSLTLTWDGLGMHSPRQPWRLLVRDWWV
jgi:hypothetical protein